jgi:hypothetical protein
LVKKSTFGKVLMVLAIAWFIYFIHTNINSHVVFWSAVGIGMAGFLLWLYGDTGIPKPSDAMLEEIERNRGIRIFERRNQQKTRSRKPEKKRE